MHAKLNLCTSLVNIVWPFGEYDIWLDPIYTVSVHCIHRRSYLAPARMVSGNIFFMRGWKFWTKFQFPPLLVFVTRRACTPPLSPQLLFLSAAPIRHCARLMVVWPQWRDRRRSPVCKPPLTVRAAIATHHSSSCKLLLTGVPARAPCRSYYRRASYYYQTCSPTQQLHALR